jgi:hypothetical protein
VSNVRKNVPVQVFWPELDLTVCLWFERSGFGVRGDQAAIIFSFVIGMGRATGFHSLLRPLSHPFARKAYPLADELVDAMRSRFAVWASRSFHHCRLSERVLPPLLCFWQRLAHADTTAILLAFLASPPF